MSLTEQELLMDKYNHILTYYFESNGLKMYKVSINGGPILDKNTDKFNWYWLQDNFKFIFEVDYEFLYKRCSIFREELLEIALHPDKICKLLNNGISFNELSNFI